MPPQLGNKSLELAAIQQETLPQSQPPAPSWCFRRVRLIRTNLKGDPAPQRPGGGGGEGLDGGGGR